MARPGLRASVADCHVVSPAARPLLMDGIIWVTWDQGQG
jgi:hypothetical protein